MPSGTRVGLMRNVAPGHSRRKRNNVPRSDTETLGEGSRGMDKVVLGQLAHRHLLSCSTARGGEGRGEEDHEALT